jgi:hypothetical protein
MLTKLLAGGAAAAALVCAAPAAAQYYPGYGYGGNPVGQIINQVLGGGYGRYGYGANQQAVVNQCAAAVQQRLSGGYDGYGYNNPYGGGYGGGRVLGISRVEPRSSGGLTVRGVATSGRYAGDGYGYAVGEPPIDLTWKCKTDYRGFIADIDISLAERNNGYGYNRGYGAPAYTPYNNGYNYDYSQYGYRRY